MSGTLGDFPVSTVVYGKFTTFQPSTGAPYTLAGSPALSVYKNNSTTESTAGVTLTVDFDSKTGLHHFTVDTSADGSFYSSGGEFDIVITAGTVDSVSLVGSVVGHFTLEKTSNLKSGDAIESGLTLLQALRLLVAAEAGKISGAATTTVTIRNAVADSKNRMVATVDVDGNRSAITYDLT